MSLCVISSHRYRSHSWMFFSIYSVAELLHNKLQPMHHLMENVLLLQLLAVTAIGYHKCIYTKQFFRIIFCIFWAVGQFLNIAESHRTRWRSCSRRAAASQPDEESLTPGAAPGGSSLKHQASFVFAVAFNHALTCYRYNFEEISALLGHSTDILLYWNSVWSHHCTAGLHQDSM